MVKEDRSHWVAVAPEFSNTQDDLPAVTPCQTAYQIFSRENSKSIKADLVAQGEPSDLAHLSKALSQKWANLRPDEKYRYEREAGADKLRFMKESHLRDKAVAERKEQLRREREEILVIDDSMGRTRGARKKESRRADRAEKKRAKAEKKARKRKLKQVEHSDEDEFASEDESSSAGDDYDSEGNDSSSQESDSDESSGRRRSKKKRAAPVVSAAVIARREKAKKEREKKEAYIAGRQEDLRTERAAQAKKRLDFLLKQSDIFRYFGEVKLDRAKYYGNRGNPKQTANDSAMDVSPEKDASSTFTHRRSITGDEEDNEELDQAVENEAVFLTSQPSTLGFGKMRTYQLEGLNWMIRLQENGVNGILADEMGLGKTIQAISLMAHIAETKGTWGPFLVIVPVTTLHNWKSELESFCPSLKVLPYWGSAEERKKLAKFLDPKNLYNSAMQIHVLITSYNLIVNNAKD